MNSFLPVTLIHFPRDICKGGGVAAIFISAVLINPKPNEKFSYKIILIISNPTMKTVVHWAPGPYSEFSSEFSEFLSALVITTDKIIIEGGFNIHVDVENNSLGETFLSLLD